MRMVLQRVHQAQVRVEGETVAAIERGLLVLVGIRIGDGLPQVAAAVRKLAGLRVFADAQGRMNLDAAAVGGAFLIVSQFTLAGSLDRGRRPSFEGAEEPAKAEALIEALLDGLRAVDLPVAGGRFGAHMDISLINDGPVTFVLDF
jgi:D-tyrosyl-tRNA(Tyr) deacylase